MPATTRQNVGDTKCQHSLQQTCTPQPNIRSPIANGDNSAFALRRLEPFNDEMGDQQTMIACWETFPETCFLRAKYSVVLKPPWQKIRDYALEKLDNGGG